jgi:hypothetical protein
VEEESEGRCPCLEPLRPCNTLEDTLGGEEVGGDGLQLGSEEAGAAACDTCLGRCTTGPETLLDDPVGDPLEELEEEETERDKSDAVAELLEQLLDELLEELLEWG